MNLRELLQVLSNSSELTNIEAGNEEVKGLKTNSHACEVGDVFIGMPGTRVDGGEFWHSAIAKGALAAIISQEAAAKTKLEPGANPAVIVTDDMISTCAAISAAFWSYPARQLKCVGVTGTNGKTTTTHLIEYFLHQAQISTALLGTLYARWSNYEQVASHTTPFAVDLQHQLAQAVAAGSQVAVMEVSSHALDQGRVLQCPFEVAVFTNLTQDHLDYHQDMDSYFAAKAKLFSPEYLTGRAIINLDDTYGQKLLEQLGVERSWSYSVSNPQADLYASDLTFSPTGASGTLHTPQGEITFTSPLVGEYNLANLLAAVGTLLHLGVDLSIIAQTLPDFAGVPGRMEKVQIEPGQKIGVFVDYAHTPDSLENLLKAARPFIPGKMICVFGCGGDRDRTKRPKMGEIAARLADVVVVTSDNPRTEEPNTIIQDILAGIPQSIQPIVTSDRSSAIETAILGAKPGDGVLIAGKGHEDYQILGTEKIHFDDREEAKKALALWVKSQ
ncbi:UDP-N-acetylmuramoyl-L-alanyl-D-glutamate--2,6-diaminopimelate ligase [Merismopedia glauca]|uniref:UDP-N-acetylmuramoyl-L-alanyl-D-glutamate--2,6-diaminopimelate ligase n=1 Tax=Merismopedia glauca CCAP 1448/3 TaxID=1296344 RepID=A0A2T1C4Q3_9CYAN|nr:UDP-N-acetylmuramoyl-L-alanyl-D-glutamate--2,6-diaminopimelate ligase [Merismopedia glauca]PSB03262.1 UDP-N-acetylmuramoyl-L-alanyl-D-glutamate--2,6-diaminopimelate ligase [Merismopedia glauca CCAP 1448/3]